MRPIDAEMLKEKLSEAIKDAPLYIQVTVDQYIDEAPTLTPPNEPLTLEQLREAPHGKIKDSTLQSICNRANEIARRPPEGETDE
ncbi:MAG TPA: hypothetical protein H9745_01915 [Candidatus Agathobaculum stercoravium]|nr:hypothetical protein [Candidatus Agathobaculum stercoravium]